jgi:hypothetical protein
MSQDSIDCMALLMLCYLKKHPKPEKPKRTPFKFLQENIEKKKKNGRGKIL